MSNPARNLHPVPLCPAPPPPLENEHGSCRCAWWGSGASPLPSPPPLLGPCIAGSAASPASSRPRFSPPSPVLDQIGVWRRRLGVVAGSGAISFLPVHWDQTARGLAVAAWIRRQTDQILELGTKELEVDDSGFVLLL
ncbi:hypothetical protein CFC21_003454 [Triticum aestivum]|uniref:Uncharacterized protein n=1 Tax=Triticum aestivum TaxID=4565 RepID=A0A3B5Y486_WHEAT|nr:hypothetical protein CFC21_003454 [Triticum aestivum]